MSAYRIVFWVVESIKSQDTNNTNASINQLGDNSIYIRRIANTISTTMMAPAKILLTQKQLNKQEKLRAQKQKQHRVPASRQTSIEGMERQAPKNNNFSSRCLRAKIFISAYFKKTLEEMEDSVEEYVALHGMRTANGQCWGYWISVQYYNLEKTISSSVCH